jgi:hypothetical protein
VVEENYIQYNGVRSSGQVSPIRNLVREGNNRPNDFLTNQRTQ